MALNQLQRCYICQEQYRAMIPMHQCFRICNEKLSVAVILQRIHFPIVSNAEKCTQVLCSICSAKIQSSYQLKQKCEQLTNDTFGKTYTNNEILRTILTFGKSTTKPEIDFDEGSFSANNEATSQLQINDETNCQDLIILSTKFTCPICHESFKHKEYLRKHSRIHNGERPYVCDVCDKAFFFSHHLKTHKLIHSGEKPYICEFCNKEFIYDHNLTRHKQTHTGEKPYVCNVCNRSFARLDILTTHKRIHFDPQRFACNVCDDTFISIQSLRRHKLLHATKAKKTFVCDVCNKSFLLLCKLKMHQLEHGGKEIEGYSHCDICNRKFDSGYMSKHKVIVHGREKTFVCDVCNKAFPSSCNLNKHKLIHTRKKPFVCDICHNAFETIEKLKGHKRCKKVLPSTSLPCDT